MDWELVYIVSGVLILPVFIWAVVASIRVHSVFSKYKGIYSEAGLTARDLVERIAAEQGLEITVEQAGGFLGDHYDPKRKVVALSHDVIDSGSIAALAIAAHECGHAIQDKESYLPLRTRNFVIRLSSFASKLLMPLIILSVFASIFIYTAAGFTFMMYVMIGLCAIYGISAVVELITLPTEFNASSRAKKLLDSMFFATMDEKERRGVSKVLSAAAQTYVASFAVSLIYFLRILAQLMLVFGSRRD
jgi:Zn-dependent membrane protease YugP